MRKEAPTITQILSYKDIYGESLSINRLELVKSIPKKALIAEIAALNYRLKSSTESRFKFDIQSQFNELKFLCGKNEDFYKQMEKRVAKAAFKLKEKGHKFNIFSRASNLLALQEIIQYGSDLPIQDFKMSLDDWKNLLQYYFEINTLTGKYINQKSEYTENENFAANQVFANELNILLNPLLIFNRFATWVNELEKKFEYSKFLANTFNPMGFSPDVFLTHIFSILIERKNPQGLDCYFQLTDDISIEKRRLFEELSKRTLADKIHDFDISEIRKGPIYQIDENKFILLDNMFLIEKCYESFIKDFFDKYLSNEESIRYDTYRGNFGNFFEEYVSQIVKRSFKKRKFWVKKYLDDLKIKKELRKEVEVADIYIRDNKKVFITQIKSNGLRNEQFSGDVTKLFTDQEGKNNDFLYKNFGLCQLIESLKYLRDDYQKFDGKFPLYKKSTSQLKPKKNKFDIYPALIVNEKMFHTPLFPQIFQEKFEKILNRDEFPDFIIRKLTIFHVEDLERLEHSLSLNKIDFWKLLREHHKKTTIVKPFYLTLDNKKINAPLNLEFQKYLNIVE